MVVPVVLASTLPRPPADVDAVLDTGADMTVIPATLRKALGLIPAESLTMRGALGETWRSVASFDVRIRVAGGPWMEIQVVESAKSYVLLGRDVLNRYILTANGPAGHFDLELPSP
jgi:hypothetical protein